MEKNDELLKNVTAKAQVWLGEAYDEETRAEVKRLLDDPDPTALIEAFYRDLEFGTGGLPGNGIKVYLFDSFRPTPELSYAIRKLGCQSGVNITASHNPKEYNGYKAYWADGAQIISPHDVNIIDRVNRIHGAEEINFKGDPSKITIIGEEIDAQFLADIKGLSLSPEAIANNRDLKIVYTPIHGTGVTLIPRSLKNYGFENIIHVPEQDVPSGPPRRIRASQRQPDRDDSPLLHHDP